MQKYFTKIVGSVSIMDDVPQTSLEKIQAAQSELEERGKFPVGIVSQPDTLALQSVILTTGRPGNLNDDVMLNEEILPILWTAALKPFNIEHTKFIVGCMFDAFAINKDTGAVVASIENFNEDESDEDREEAEAKLRENIDSLPENLDIITNQVLWAQHFPQEVAAIKRKAISGELFVSMEVWFTSYDYLVGNRIIKRTPEIAEILDSKLRIKGGSGFFGIDRVKRVPRNLTFAGNAAVETPANPESFILNVMDRGDLMDAKELENMEEPVEATGSLMDKEHIDQLFADNTLCILESLSDTSEASKNESDALEAGRSGNHLGSEASSSLLASTEIGEVVTHSEELIMPFDEKKFVELVESNALVAAELKDANAALAEVNKETEELQAKNAELEAKLEETLTLVKEHEDALAAKAEAFEKLEADKVELDLKLEETSATLTEIEEERKLDIRKAALGELGLSDERIVKVLAKTSELDEDAFGAEVEDLKALMTELTPVPSVIDDVVETPEVAADEVVEEEVEAPIEEEEVEELEASEEEISEVLDEAEEEEAPVAEALGSVNTESEEDEVSQIQSAMAKALGVRL
jgi:hypothetical protein